MSLLSRITNLFRSGRLSREIDEELESHIQEAIEHGRDPAEARRAFGSILRHREESRDIRLIPWLDSLRADVVFGWRQLRRNRVTSVAAVLSLGLAIGACTAAFRLMDALLLRPLPIAAPDRLYVIGRRGIDPGGNFRISESGEYPLFQRVREAAKNEAEFIAVSYADRADITYASDEETERVWRQYVSGSMFRCFGLRPALGRLLTEADDLTPRAHPYAVLSYSYWVRRFGRDPNVIGRSFRMGNDQLQIVGVVEKRFTGTEPGTMIDIFIPTMMNEGVTHADWSWFRPLVQVRPGVALGPLRDKLQVIYQAFQEERAKSWTAQTRQFLDRFLHQTVVLEPAGSGASFMQKNYRQAMIALGVLVALVLLIACANVANLMIAQAASRAREMAMRVSLGAGRWRLVQLVLVESAWLGGLAASLGACFAWWSAPFVASRINPADNPARLVLPADARVVCFSLVLTIIVTLFFGLIPALRASSVLPASALKGGEDPHSRHRLTYGLVAAQVAFCLLVTFAAGLFVNTFERLANQPTGFSAERLLVLDTVGRRPQSPIAWREVTEHLRQVPGVQSAALCGWPLLSGNGWNGFIWTQGKPSEVLAYFLAVSPGWIETMKIPLLAGRDLRPGDTYPGVAVVNEAFVRQFFRDGHAVGQTFERENGDGRTRTRLQIIGIVADARYRNMREPITPTVFVPFESVDQTGTPSPKGGGALVVRTSAWNPMAMASILRREVSRAQPELRVSTIHTQQELVEQHTVRERLLALLAIFFAAVALLLAAVGLYGVLHYSVVQRRREIGIRIAIGATAGEIARRVTARIFSMVLLGAAAGLALGITTVRYVTPLLYQVRATDWIVLAVPAVTVTAAAVVAALPAVIHAIRIDPVKMLRVE